MGRRPLTAEQKEERRIALNAKLREQYANDDKVRDKKKKRYSEKSDHIKAYSMNRYYSRKRELEELRMKVKELEAKIPQ